MRAERLFGGPIIKAHMDSRMGDNINGPSLIRVPEWIERPLGRYYLYFAHHTGTYIRLAYSDTLAGPWTTREEGVLPLKDSLFDGHVASPDIHIDGDRREIRMYYHGKNDGDEAQRTRCAVSADGLSFTALEPILGSSYWRVFFYRGMYYSLEMKGKMYRSPTPRDGFVPGPRFFDDDMRHAALLLRGDTLHVFYSRVGDAPEHILRAEIRLGPDWSRWTAGPGESFLVPEMPYEGADLPVAPSVRGLARVPVRQLRDPAIFEEAGRTYLLYSIAGESGIAMAEIV